MYNTEKIQRADIVISFLLIVSLLVSFRELYLFVSGEGCHWEYFDLDIFTLIKVTTFSHPVVTDFSLSTCTLLGICGFYELYVYKKLTPLTVGILFMSWFTWLAHMPGISIWEYLSFSTGVCICLGADLFFRLVPEVRVALEQYVIESYFHLEDYFYGRFDCDELMATITPSRRKGRDWNTSSVHDGNKVHNIRRWIYLSRHKYGEIDVSVLCGYTIVGGVHLPYPVACDPSTLYRFRDFCHQDRKRWKMFLTGVYDRGICDPAPLFHLYNAAHASAALGVFDMLHVNKAIAHYLFGWLHGSFIDFGNYITYCAVEEIFNSISRAPIMIFECIGAFRSAGWRGIVLKLLVHGTLLMFPMWVQIPLHWFWNSTLVRMVPEVPPPPGMASAISSDVLAHIEGGAAVLQFSHLLYKGDYTGVCLELLRKSSVIVKWFEGFDLVEIQEAMRDYFEVLQLTGKPIDEVYTLVELAFGEEDKPKLSKLNALMGWLPKRYAKSGTTAAMLALVTTYALNLEPETCSWFGRLLRDVSIPTIAVDSANALAQNTVTVIYSIYNAMNTEGTIMDKINAFFGESRQTSFVNAAIELQKRELRTATDMQKWLNDAEEFVKEWGCDGKRLPSGFENLFTTVNARIPQVMNTLMESELSALMTVYESTIEQSTAGMRSKVLLAQEIVSFVKDRLNGVVPRSLYTQYHNIIQDLRSKLDSLNMVSRPRPFPIIMYGEPGSGKTFALMAIMVCLYDLFNKVNKHFGFPEVSREEVADSVTPISFEKKHAIAGTVYSSNLCILANDIPGVTTESAKSDKGDLAVMLQQILDTSALFFTAPEIAQKRVAHRPQLLYVTSNNSEFMCAGETEKLIRRMAQSCIFYCYFEGPNGEVVPAEKAAGFTVSERREMMRFIVSEFHAQHKRFWFTKTQTKLTYHTLTLYIREKFEAHVNSIIEEDKLYGNHVARCRCGKTPHDHVYGSGEKAYYHVIEGFCDEPPREFSALVRRDRHGGNVLGAASAVSDLYSFIYTAICTYVVLLVYRKYEKWTNDLLEWMRFNESELVSRLLILGDRYPKLMSIATYPSQESNRLVLKAYAKALRRMDDLKIAVRRFLGPVLAILGVSMIAYSIRPRSAPTKDAGSPNPAVKSEAIVEAPKVSKTEIQPLAVAHITSADKIAAPKRLEIHKPDSDHVRDYEHLKNSAEQAGWKVHDFSRAQASFSTSQVGEKDLISLCERTTIPVKIGVLVDGSWKENDAYIVCVAPNWIGFNKHYLNKVGPDHLCGIEHLGGHHGSHPFSIRFKLEDLCTIDGQEFYYLEHILQTFPSASSQLKFWVDDVGDAALDIVYPIRGPGWFSEVVMSGTVYRVVTFKGFLEKGACGTPVVAVCTNGPRKGSHYIVGHVCARKDSLDGSEVCASTVSKTRFLEMAKKENSVVPLGCVFDIQELPEHPLAFVSAFQALHKDCVSVVLGSDGKNTSTFKTSHKPTAAHDFVQEKLPEPHGVPNARQVKGMMKDGIFVSPVTHATQPCGNKKSDARRTEMIDAVDHLVGGVVKAYREEHGEKKIRPLTLHEAVVGVPGFVSKTEMKKSVGPVAKSVGVPTRYDLFEEFVADPEFYDEGNMRLTKLGEERMMAILEVIDNDELFAVATEWKIKDEVRPVSKLEIGKIRLFCVLDFVFNLLARCYLLPLITVWLRYPEVSECYGAMNAGGPEAGRLKRRLGKFPNFFDADFKVFDGSHESLAFFVASRGIYEFSLEMGYSEKEARRSALLMLSVAFAVLKYGRDYVLKAFGFPSGFIATLWFNSFVNSILMRIIYRRLVGALARFHEHVATANVGDDQASSVADEIKGVFNMVNFVIEAENLGYTATPAKKGSLILPFIEEKDQVFLKRSWYFHPLAQDWVLALDKSSLWKAFGWHDTSSAIGATEKIIQVAHGNQIEAWLHGPEYFTQFQRELCDMFSSIGLPPPELLSSDDLLDRWRANELRSWAM